MASKQIVRMYADLVDGDPTNSDVKSETSRWHLLVLRTTTEMTRFLTEKKLDSIMYDWFRGFVQVLDLARADNRSSSFDSAFEVIFVALARMREALKDDDDVLRVFLLHLESVINTGPFIKYL
jgi:hypothetical protein